MKIHGVFERSSRVKKYRNRAGIQKNLNCLLERITRAINIAYKNKKTLYEIRSIV